MKAGVKFARDSGNGMGFGASGSADISLTYQTPLSEHTELLAKLVHAENYGNRLGQSDTGAVLAISFSF